MRKLNKSKTTGTWFEFPSDKSFKLNIRPLNVLSMNTTPSSTKTTTKQMWEWFNYILIDWSGYIDEDGIKIECNEEMKEIVYNFDQEVLSFCIDKATELKDQIVTQEEANNLKK